MARNKICGIYKIESPTGKIYIGQSKDILRRWRHYRSLGCKMQPYLYNSFLKHGTINHKFDILHELPFDVSQKVLNDYELFYINQYKMISIMLNLKGGLVLGSHSIESREKMSISRKGVKQSKEAILKKIASTTGKKRTEDACKNISKSLTGRKLSKETKIKISAAHKGKCLSEKTRKLLSESRRGRNNHFFGKHHSEDTKKKISTKKKGSRSSEETKKKISLSNIGKHSTPRSDETKEKIRKSRIWKKHSQETKKKMSQSLTGRKMPRHAIEAMMKKRLLDGTYKKLNQCLSE